MGNNNGVYGGKHHKRKQAQPYSHIGCACTGQCTHSHAVRTFNCFHSDRRTSGCRIKTNTPYRPCSTVWRRFSTVHGLHSFMRRMSEMSIAVNLFVPLSMRLPVFFTFILISFDLVSFYLLYFSFVALIRIILAFLRREKHFST